MRNFRRAALSLVTAAVAVFGLAACADDEPELATPPCEEVLANEGQTRTDLDVAVAEAQAKVDDPDVRGPSRASAEKDLAEAQKAETAFEDEVARCKDEKATADSTTTSTTEAVATTVQAATNVTLSPESIAELQQKVPTSADPDDPNTFTLSAADSSQDTIAFGSPDGSGIDWALNAAEERGPAALSDKTLKSDAEIKAYARGGTTGGNAYLAEANAALAPHGATVEDCVFIPLQFLEDVNYVGIAYLSGLGVVYNPNERGAQRGDVYWLCTIPQKDANGQQVKDAAGKPLSIIVWQASLRADCGNGGLDKAVPATATPGKVPSVEVPPTPEEPTCPPHQWWDGDGCLDRKIPALDVMRNPAVTDPDFAREFPGAGTRETAPDPVATPGTKPPVPTIHGTVPTTVIVDPPEAFVPTPQPTQPATPATTSPDPVERPPEVDVSLPPTTVTPATGPLPCSFCND